MPQVRRSALLPYSAGQIFDLVGDIERYPEFLPWCSAAQIVGSKPSEVVAELTIMKGRISERFKTRNVLTYPDSIELQLVEGPFKRLSGIWRFTGLAAQGSKVELELDFEMSKSLIQKSLGILFAHAAGTMVDAFCARARLVYGPGSS
ncbi:MAG: type II toxin-antitoxin system RatA family toxin [Proteobacteria bacterium]|nr:type II toxin-antitoxin system RatA family toxin [Pseudomonadota bacterium]